MSGTLSSAKRKIGSLTDILNDFQSVRNQSVVSVLVNNEDKILSQIKERLIQGLGSDLSKVHDMYEEDLQPSGFFKSRDTARAYQRMKYHRFNVTPTTGGANLFMTGKIYETLYIDHDDVSFEITSDYSGRSLVSARGVIASYQFNSHGKAFRPPTTGRDPSTGRFMRLNGEESFSGMIRAELIRRILNR